MSTYMKEPFGFKNLILLFHATKFGELLLNLKEDLEDRWSRKGNSTSSSWMCPSRSFLGYKLLPD